jgi:hypothetical protein
MAASNYNNFTVEKLFSNENFNIICNRIVDRIRVNNPSLNLNTHFAITGSVAKILQGDSVKDILVMPFITSDNQLFNYIASNLGRDVDAKEVIVFKDRVHLTFKNFLVEIHLVENLNRLVQVNNFNLQHKDDVPSEIN